jgi:hypothetical protein
MEKNFYVYMHIKEVDGTPFYIGKGKAYRAFIKSKRSDIWNKYYNKYGFDIIFLEENIDEYTAFEKEKYWIERIGRLKLNNGPLINLTDGGEGTSGLTPWNKGKKHSEETKLKISNIHKGNTYRRGSKLSKETKSKISKSKINKISSHKEIIDIETGIFYYTITEAAEAYNIKRTTLNARLKGQNKNNTNLRYI